MELDVEQASEAKHDANAASSPKKPSSKGKKPISEMVAAFRNLDEEVQEDEDHWADDSDDEEDRTLAEHANVHLGVSHLKRKLIAPQSFSKKPNLNSHDYMARYQVLATLRKELSQQNEEVIASVPDKMKKFTELITQRTTSLVISQRDLGMVMDDDNTLAEKALNEASYAVGKADATQGPLSTLR